MVIFTLSTAIAVLVGSLLVEQVQCARTVKKYKANNNLNKMSRTLASANEVPSNCFPAVDFKMPYAVPTSVANWWCNTDAEYAFVGFSYDISLCDFYEIDVFFIWRSP